MFSPEYFQIKDSILKSKHKFGGLETRRMAPAVKLRPPYLANAEIGGNMNNNNNLRDSRPSKAGKKSNEIALYEASRRSLKSLQSFYEAAKSLGKTPRLAKPTKTREKAAPLGIVPKHRIQSKNNENVAFPPRINNNGGVNRSTQWRPGGRLTIPRDPARNITYTRSRTEPPDSLMKGAPERPLPPISKSKSSLTSLAGLRKAKEEAKDMLSGLRRSLPRKGGVPPIPGKDTNTLTESKRTSSVLSIFQGVTDHGITPAQPKSQRSMTVALPRTVASFRNRSLAAIKNHIQRSRFSPNTYQQLRKNEELTRGGRERSSGSLEDDRQSRSRGRENGVKARSRSVSLVRELPPPTAWNRKIPRSRSVSLVGSRAPSRGREPVVFTLEDTTSRPGTRGRSNSRSRSRGRSRSPSQSRNPLSKTPNMRRSKSSQILPYQRASSVTLGMSRNASRLSVASTTADEGQGGGKKEKQAPLFTAIKPDNAVSEKEKFFRSNFTYNPQFKYTHPMSQDALHKYSRASDQYLDLSLKIMNHALQRFGTYERYMETTAGRKLSRYEIIQAAKLYLEKENMSAEVDVNLSEDLLSRARMAVIGGRPTVIIRALNMREGWVDGMLRHEIGTHYMRAWNNKQHVWGKAKKRKDLGLEPANPTEEGLASLHSVLFRKEPVLWRCALLYYTIYQSTKLSFVELFRDLGRFAKDPEVRWEYCLRAKRGQDDTSLPGGFTKDQVYLRGALEILKHRDSIDFHLMVRCGKVSWRDLSKLKEMDPDDHMTRIPLFMKDDETYRKELDRIVMKNGLTEVDLQFIT